jgi:membrane associated rhomboid family serine protease
MSLPYRLAIGLSIFAVLAIVDLRRNGAKARRWREYCFLAVIVAVAMAYGMMNDCITSAISWEYFYYGKELSPILGPQTPPDRAAMRWQAMKVGMQATWSVGLILGAVLLMANNPRPSRPPLSFTRLFAFVLAVFVFTAFMAVVMGFIGSRGGLNWCSPDFREMARDNLFRPSHFMTAWGVHLGGYLGGILGGIIAVWRVLARRSQPAMGVAPVPVGETEFRNENS